MHSCLEHIDEAMDRFLDEKGKLPILIEEDVPNHCDLCQNPSVYKIIAGEMSEEY